MKATQNRRHLGQKLIVLLMVVSLATAGCFTPKYAGISGKKLNPVIAQRKEGVRLVIKYKNTDRIAGELIQVNKNPKAIKQSILVLEEKRTKAQVNIPIGDIASFNIARTNRTLEGMALGILVGGAMGFIMGINSRGGLGPRNALLWSTLFCSIPGLGIGTISGSAASISEKVLIGNITHDLPPDIATHAE